MFNKSVLKNIVTAAVKPAVFWSGVVAFMLIYKGAAIIFLTPFAWVLGLEAGRVAVMNSRATNTGYRLVEAALAGVLLGLYEGLLFIIVANFLPAGDQSQTAAAWMDMAIPGGMLTGGLTALLTGWLFSRTSGGKGRLDSAPACPVCGGEIRFDPRYPRAVCGGCAARTADDQGRPVKFYNEEMSGGLRAVYTDTDWPYAGEVCWVDGVKCRAREGHLGGVVVEKD